MEAYNFIQEEDMLLKVFIGGVFDDEGGRPSGFINKLTSELIAIDSGWVVINGGTYEQLVSFIESFEGIIGTLCWFCDVPNDKPKIVNSIITKTPETKLVISKNNRSNKYTKLDLQTRIELAKASILLEFTESEGKIQTSIHSKSGLTLLEKEIDITRVARFLEESIK